MLGPNFTTFSGEDVECGTIYLPFESIQFKTKTYAEFTIFSHVSISASNCSCTENSRIVALQLEITRSASNIHENGNNFMRINYREGEDELVSSISSVLCLPLPTWTVFISHTEGSTEETGILFGYSKS